MAGRLLKTHTVTFYTLSSDPVLQSDGYWSRGSGTTTMDVQGSLQPHTPFKKKIPLPEGARSQDAKIFITKTLIQSFDQFDNLSASWALLDGKRYTIFKFEDWTGFGLNTDHYLYALLLDNPK